MSEDATELAALWAAIDAMPEDALRRGVLADFLDERAGVVACEKCKPQHAGRIYTGMDGMKWIDCTCDRGFIPDGRADMARALRATAGMVPSMWAAGRDGDGREFVFERSMSDQPEPEFFSYLGAGPFAAQDTADLSIIECNVFDAMEGESGGMYFMLGKHGHRRYETASAAIKDLCRAYITVHCKSEASR